MSEFEGAVVLVTAAAGLGIGQAVARRFARGGARVVVTDIHERRTREVAKAMAEDYPDSEIVGLCIAIDAEGLTVQTNNVDATEFTWAADNYHVERVEFDFAGEPWEFVADPRGTRPDMGAIPNPQQEGLMRRVGETRQPVHWTLLGRGQYRLRPAPTAAVYNCEVASACHPST